MVQCADIANSDIWANNHAHILAWIGKPDSHFPKIE